MAIFSAVVMREKIAVIDAWTQLIPPVDQQHPTAAGVFKKYGRFHLVEHGTTVADLLQEMDAAGVEKTVLTCTSLPEHDTRRFPNDRVAEAVKAHPGRFIGQVHLHPTNIMRAVRDVEYYVTTHGFKSLRIEPFLWGKPPTDKMYYPLYAKCVELDIAFQTQVGNTGPLFPSFTGDPMYIDEVALDFPELRIVCGHIGWPWTEAMIAVAWKHPNVYIDTSAHPPRYFPPRFVHFLKSFGQDKCLFATDWPVLSMEECLREVDERLDLASDVRRKFLRDNAVRAFKLEG